MRKAARILRIACCGVMAIAALGAIKTLWDVDTPSLSLRMPTAEAQRFQVTDRNGVPLALSFHTKYNQMDRLPLYAMPDLLRQAMVTAEDKRFYQHSGIDWHARLSAIEQNLRAGHAIRGASTISEQVVRILNPRPRTMWSRWIEGWEAMLLERHASKGEILEFYMNQVPYAANRRGVAQAARYYFNRDLSTLTPKEMLALAVLPRAPSALDLYYHPDAINPALERLVHAMAKRGELTKEKVLAINHAQLNLEPPEPPLDASHFIHYIRENVSYQLSENGVLRTTLDVRLQRQAQHLLNERIKALHSKRVRNGAVMVVDHVTGEIMVWAVAGAGDGALRKQTPGSAIDAVRALRQPGSAMKPFLYAKALDMGWTAATMLQDAPMTEAVGTGQHQFKNYSNVFYGNITLREALGNSLNIPALQTIGFVKPDRYLETLHQLGFTSLNQSPRFYHDGLALGNGEVSLYEMVQAYAALANRGLYRPLTPLPQPPSLRPTTRIYSEEAASLIGNILSDPFARRQEFGAGSVLNLPVQTAVKTGTSTDYRDAWVLGYNSRYGVGVWLGNLDHTPMNGVTGSTGPALILRSLFAELSAHEKQSPLYLSPKLVQSEICLNPDAKGQCFPRSEYFIAGTDYRTPAGASSPQKLTLTRPTQGLQIAYDPRIPAAMQAFEFVAEGVAKDHQVEWQLNGAPVSRTQEGRYLWPVARGKYRLVANEITADETIVATDKVAFQVK